MASKICFLHLLLLVSLVCPIFLPKAHGFIVQDCECGVPNSNATKRIVGGTETGTHEFPWIAAILYKSFRVICGGAVINNRYILTAGHCVNGNDYRLMSTYLGLHDKSRGGDEYFFDRAILHDDFTSDSLHDTNDIALLRTQRVIKYSAQVKPICLPHPVSQYYGRTAIVAGWGRTGTNSYTSNLLLKTKVQVIRLQTCLYTEDLIAQHLADTMMCAYARNHDACAGDSGGPLMYARNPEKIEIIGVVSWGDECAKVRSPGIYTSVAPFIDWIADNTQDAKYCHNS